VTAYQQAVSFFKRHAGFSYDPSKETPQQGRLNTARELARAEAKAANLGWEFEWTYDAVGCSGCDCGRADCDCATGEEHETLGCILFNDEEKSLESLWGICNPTPEYKRVVQAELALEALGI
jgi:hypothetical protein